MRLGGLEFQLQTVKMKYVRLCVNYADNNYRQKFQHFILKISEAVNIFYYMKINGDYLNKERNGNIAIKITIRFEKKS